MAPQQVFFIYGCTTAAAAALLYVVAATGHNIVPSTAGPAVAVLLIHLTVLALTNSPAFKNTPAVVDVSPRRIRLARRMLLAGFGFCLLHVAVVVVASPRFALHPSAALMQWGLETTLACLLMLTSLQIALSWAVRPQNLFGTKLWTAIYFPGYAVGVRGRRRARDIRRQKSRR